MSLQRIVIVGKPGAGKTTLAATLSSELNLKNVELDAINWQENWTALPKPEFRAQVDKQLSPTGHWVTDGNYTRSVCDIVWGRADTLVWLDYPLHVALWRLLKRTARRIWSGGELWNGNKETLQHHLDLRDPVNHLFVWCVRMHFNQRTNYPRILGEEAYRHLKVLRFRRPAELEEWLRGLTGEDGEEIEMKSLKSKAA
jgi:GTPase SAR1 family protein